MQHAVKLYGIHARWTLHGAQVNGVWANAVRVNVVRVNVV